MYFDQLSLYGNFKEKSTDMMYFVQHSSGENFSFTSDFKFDFLIQKALKEDGFIHLKNKEGEVDKIIGVDFLRNSIITISEEQEDNPDISSFGFR